MLMADSDKVGILLVDDRPENLLSETTVLDVLGEDIVQASSGRGALRQLLDRDFGVILMDVNMPGLSGFETAALIRERKRSENTPIIFVTAVHQTELHAMQGYNVGAVDYLFSPIVPEILLAKVRVFVNLHRMTARVERQAQELLAANEALRAEALERERAQAEVQQLNEALKRRADELSSANAELKTFAHTVSHDLRAPLRSISGFADLLVRKYAPGLDDTAKDYIQRVLSSCKHMGLMMDALMELSKATRAQMVRQPVDLSNLATAIAHDLDATRGDRHIEWVIAPGLAAQGDERYLRVVFQNLLANAFKFTAKQPAARIEVGAVTVKGQPAFFVRDNGIGFDMAEAGRLFAPFQRLSSAAGHEGTGSGLTMVQRIVERHGGRVWAESALGKGATFFLTLP